MSLLNGYALTTADHRDDTKNKRRECIITITLRGSSMKTKIIRNSKETKYIVLFQSIELKIKFIKYNEALYRLALRGEL